MACKEDLSVYSKYFNSSCHVLLNLFSAGTNAEKIVYDRFISIQKNQHITCDTIMLGVCSVKMWKFFIYDRISNH